LVVSNNLVNNGETNDNQSSRKSLSNGTTGPLQIQTTNLPMKAHLKSPPLASLYETSVENLLEAGGTPKENLAVIAISNAATAVKNVKLIRQKSSENETQMKFKSRPRFNTLELDLSCTKNKFPIRDRSKVDFSPTISNNSSSQSVTTPTTLTTATIPHLFCEQRLLTSSKSEATLSKK
jgi:rapamycin-insensitive companion of mTOR